MMCFFFDNASTTQCNPLAVDVMAKYLIRDYANPSSIHHMGTEVASDIDSVKKVVLEKINANQGDVVFTSGGTEANNLAILGTAAYLKKIGKTHIITTPFEHSSVLECIKTLQNDGFDVTYLSVKDTGVISISELKEAITNKTGLVSVMAVNNEVGTIQPLYEIGKVCKEHDILFHTDAIQALGNIPINVDDFGIDLLSASGHKFHAPKGVGFLYVKQPTILSSIIKGGGQQGGLRAGTQNVPAIMAMKFVLQTRHVEGVQHLSQFLVDALRKRLGNKVSFPCRDAGNAKISPKIISITIKDIDAQTLVLALAAKDIYISAGSACHSTSTKPSHVLKAIGLTDKEANETIRVSLSNFTKVSDIYKFVDELTQLIPLIEKT